jgi:alpha-galactosidase
VSFYKQHRDVLDNGDIIHLRRPNGRDWDGILHANPAGAEKGLACFYNPLAEPITREVRIPLHYTGLRGGARVSIDGIEPSPVALNAANETVLTLKIPAQGRSFVVFTE